MSERTDPPSNITKPNQNLCFKKKKIKFSSFSRSHAAYAATNCGLALFSKHLQLRKKIISAREEKKTTTKKPKEAKVPRKKEKEKSSLTQVASGLSFVASLQENRKNK